MGNRPQDTRYQQSNAGPAGGSPYADTGFEYPVPFKPSSLYQLPTGPSTQNRIEDLTRLFYSAKPQLSRGERGYMKLPNAGGGFTLVPVGLKRAPQYLYKIDGSVYAKPHPRAEYLMVAGPGTIDIPIGNSDWVPPDSPSAKYAAASAGLAYPGRPLTRTVAPLSPTAPTHEGNPAAPTGPNNGAHIGNAESAQYIRDYYVQRALNRELPQHPSEVDNSLLGRFKAWATSHFPDWIPFYQKPKKPVEPIPSITRFTNLGSSKEDLINVEKLMNEIRVDQSEAEWSFDPGATNSLKSRQLPAPDGVLDGK